MKRAAVTSCASVFAHRGGLPQVRLVDIAARRRFALPSAALACCLGALYPAHDAHAGSGFLLRSQSATTLGTAQAGMSTTTEDISAMVFNPALLAYAKRTELVLGVTPIFSTGRFEPSAATTILGTPIAGGNGGTPAETGWPINAFVATPLSDGVSVGLAITSLYGLSFEWDSGWVGRYHAGESELFTVDLVPSLSYKLGPVAFGLGIDIRYARAKTTTAIDFGTLAFSTTGGAVGVPAGNDGSLSTRLDDWGVGVIVGAVFEPGPPDQTRIGVSYRSKIETTLKGRATFDTGGPVGQAIAAASGQFTNTDSSAPLTFPAAVIVGLDQKLSAKWRLLADVQWMQWSSLKELTLRFANPLQQTINTDLRWRDSWFVAAGLRYQLNDHWVLRTGVAYDQTPTRHETSTPAIPDASGVWLDVGAGYTINRNTKVDVAYGHIFVKDNPISLQATAPGNALRGNLEGTIRNSSVNFVGLQISHKF